MVFLRSATADALLADSAREGLSTIFAPSPTPIQTGVLNELARRGRLRRLEGGAFCALR